LAGSLREHLKGLLGSSKVLPYFQSEPTGEVPEAILRYKFSGIPEENAGQFQFEPVTVLYLASGPVDVRS
jgi:hypothetical protein